MDGAHMGKVRPHHTSQPFNSIRNVSIGCFQIVEVRMNRLLPLLAHQSKSYLPLIDPVNYVLLQHMHFWYDRKLLPIERHERRDVHTFGRNYKVICVISLCTYLGKQFPPL